MLLNQTSHAAELQVNENLDGDYAYISALTIDGKSTGSEPFDDSDNPGSDSSADNDIIRSFDTAIYSVKFVTTSYDDQQYFENARVGFRFILDETDEDVATFGLDSMLWVDTTPGYEPKVTVEEIDGEQHRVLTCYRRLVSTSDVPTVVPSTNTVNFVLEVGAAINGTKLNVNVEAWCEHNVTDGVCPTHADDPNTHGDEVANLSIDKLTVSAAPKYNVMLKEMNESDVVGNGDYDFDDTSLVAGNATLNTGAGVVNGRLYGYGIVLQLYNDTPEKRLKGIELPTGPITFNLSLASSLRIYGNDPIDVTKGYTPLVWSIDANSNDDEGNCARAVDINGQKNDFAINTVPFNEIDAKADYEQLSHNSCYQGGTWHATQTGGNSPVVSVTVDGYEINLDSFPYTDAGRGVNESHIYYAGDEVQNIGCFSAGELFVVQPFYNDETGESFFDEFDCDNGDFTVTVTDTKLHATSMSGQETYDDGVANQSNVDDDMAIMTQSAFRGVEASPYIFYSYCDNVGAESSGTDMLDYEHNYNDGTDSAFPGTPIRIVAGYEVTTYQDATNIAASNIFIRFDDKAIRYDPTREIGYRGDDLAPNRALFAAKPDGMGWVDDDEQQTTSANELVFYDDYQDLIDSGAVCVGLMYETRTIQDTIAYHWRRSSFPVVVRDDAEIRHVAMTTAESMLWTKQDIMDAVAAWCKKDAQDLTDDDYQEYLDTQFPSIADSDAWFDEDGNMSHEPSLVLDSGGDYVKTRYDEHGLVENHSGTYQFGDSLLILGEKMIVDKHVAQDNHGSHKEIFDMDYAQRYVDYVISSSFDMSENPSAASDYTTNVTITDTLPDNLTYVPESAYIGGTYAESNGGQAPGTVTGGTQIEPTSIRNDDGLIELSWEIPDVAYGAEIDDIHFTCLIGTPGDDESDVSNGDQIVNNVRIRSTNDIRDARPEYMNKTSCTIRISKLRSQSLAIRPIPTLNEQSSEVSFVSMLGNYSGTTKVGVGVNLLPYDGDGMSKYDGTYEVLNLDVEDTSDMSQLTFYCTNDASIRGTDISEITQDDIEGGWVECEFDPDTGEVTVPDGYEHMVAWAVIDSSMTPNERIDVTTNIMPSENAGGNVYGSALSDGDNVVTARLYVVGRFVSGHVFIDANGNDAYDEGEVLFENASVRLVDEDGDVVEAVDGDACEMLTDENGYYEFDAVPDGEFRIEFKPCDGDGWSYLSAVAVDAADDDVDSDATPTLEDEVLIGAYIDGIEMPSIDDMASSVYRSDHNDLGLRVDGTADIDIVKSATVKHQESCADKGETAHVGDAIEYRAVITNTGSTTLTDVWVTDTLLNIDKKLVAEELAAGDDVEISLGTHTVTADDIAASIVRNSVTTNGTPPRYVTPPDDVSDEVETPVVGSAEIDITKSTSVTHVENPEVGDVIPYTITITNVGDVTITDITATDALSDIGDLILDKTTLAAGESVTVNVEHKLTQADIENGQVVNTATTTGKFGNDEPSDESDEVVTTLEQTPAISLVKSTDDKVLDVEHSIVGEVINYDFIITNTGNVTLHDVNLVDHLAGVYDLAIDWESSSDNATGEGILSSGETVTATAKYNMIQADIDTGKVENTATVTGMSPSDEQVDDDASAETVLTAAPSINLVKSTESKQLDAEHSVIGEVIDYTFTIINTGNVTLHDVELVDHLDGVYDLNVDWSTSSDESTANDVLSVGETVSATAKYNLTQADIDAGKVTNTATATGTSPADEQVDDDASAETMLTGTPAISLVKSTEQKEIDAENSVVGTVIDYDFVITNTGNMTLRNVKLTDHLNGVYDLNVDWDSSSDDATEDGVLSVGETVSAIGKYKLTQGDIDAGKVINTATVTGTSDNGEDVNDDSSTETTLSDAPSISLVKSTDDETLDAEHSVVGEVVDYDFVITNIGNVTLHDVKLTDHLDGVYDMNIDWNGSSDDATDEGILSVGETVKATAKYKLTQSDIDTGKVTNAATTTGISPKDDQVDDDSSAETVLAGMYAIKLDKSTNIGSIDAEHAVAGMQIPYTFTITNTGSVTLHDVTLTDKMLSEAGIAVDIDWDGSSDAATGTGVLSPSETVSGTAKYNISDADIKNGKVVNNATVTGTPDNGEPVSDDDDATTTIEQATPHLTLTKTSDVKLVSGDDAVAGTVVSWTIKVTNDGNVRVDGIAIDDKLTGAKLIANDFDGTLEVGESVELKAEYALTDKDVDGSDVATQTVSNTASAHGTYHGDKTVQSNEDTDTVDIRRNPLIELEKTVDIDRIENDDVKVGKLLTYTFVVMNTGDMTVNATHIIDSIDGMNVTVIDSPLGNSNTTLPPDSEMTFTAQYAITQDDIDAGKVINTAHAAGELVDSTPIESNEDDAATDIVTSQHISIDKSVDIEQIDAPHVGDILTYSFIVTNDGDTTLENVGINDDKNGLSDVIIDWSTSSDDATGDGVLSPDETVTATATYAITQADIDAGEVMNIATSYGDAINSGKHVESVPDDAVTIISTKPHISIVKDVDIKQNDDAKVGDVLTYSFTVKNDGNVTLTDISIDDTLAGISELVFDWDNSTDASTADGTLSPNESVVATATYAITQTDIGNGNVVNTATSHGYHDGDYVESNPSSVETVLSIKHEIPVDDDDDDIDKPITDDDVKHDDGEKPVNGASSDDTYANEIDESIDDANSDDSLVKTDDNVPSIVSTGVSNVFVTVLAGISLIVSGIIIIRKIK